MSLASMRQKARLALAGLAMGTLPMLAFAQRIGGDFSDTQPVSEPETLGLLAAAGVAVAVVRWMRRK